MTREDGVYRIDAFDNSGQVECVDIRGIPEGWRPILQPKRDRGAILAALAAVLAWLFVAISAMNTLAG